MIRRCVDSPYDCRACSPGRGRLLGPEDVHVLALLDVRLPRGMQPPGESRQALVVGGVLPEAVDVEPVARRAVGERGRVLGHSREGAADVVDVDTGALPGHLSPEWLTRTSMTSSSSPRRRRHPPDGPSTRSLSPADLRAPGARPARDPASRSWPLCCPGLRLPAGLRHRVAAPTRCGRGCSAPG